jgi:hypothetical protein
LNLRPPDPQTSSYRSWKFACMPFAQVTRRRRPAEYATVRKSPGRIAVPVAVPLAPVSAPPRSSARCRSPTRAQELGSSENSNLDSPRPGRFEGLPAVRPRSYVQVGRMCGTFRILPNAPERRPLAITVTPWKTFLTGGTQPASYTTLRLANFLGTDLRREQVTTPPPPAQGRK